MMTVKYIIEMTHTTALGEKSTYYYKGQDKKCVNHFTTNKRAAKRYLNKEVAIRDKCILKIVHECKTDTFNVIDINCRI